MLLKVFSKLFAVNIYHSYSQGQGGKKIICLHKMSRKFQKAAHTQVLATIFSSWREDWSILLCFVIFL